MKNDQPVRFHRREYPLPGELVIGKNVKITELGVYVNLMEYGNLEGLVVIGELSKKRIRNIHKLIKINKIEVLSVLRVDKTKGYIDLSRKKVIESDFNNTYRSYMKNKIANNIIISLSNRLNQHPMKLYQEWAWDKSEQYNTLYEYFGLVQEAYNYKLGIAHEKIYSDSDDSSSSCSKKNIGTSERKRPESTEHYELHPDESRSGASRIELGSSSPLNQKLKSLFTSNVPKHSLSTLLKDIPNELHNLLLEQINVKYNVQKVRIRADVELTCYGPDGVDAIKQSLFCAQQNDEDENKNNEIKTERLNSDTHKDDEYSVQITLLKPPTYSLSLQTDHIDKGKLYLNYILEKIKKKLLSYKGSHFELISTKCFGIKDRKLDESDEE